MNDKTEFDLLFMRSCSDLPPWLDRSALVDFFHTNLSPYNDEYENVSRGLSHALSDENDGFIIAALSGRDIVGAIAILSTGMVGYIPENLLLYVGVLPKMRGQGLGARLVSEAATRCDGDLKLHVDFDNPARRLYERLGFRVEYYDMRLEKTDDVD